MLIGTGLLRIATPLKGAAFYSRNPVFWAKMGLFGLVALLSVLPTMHYLGRHAASYSVIRAHQTAQLIVFFTIQRYALTTRIFLSSLSNGPCIRTPAFNSRLK